MRKRLFEETCGGIMGLLEVELTTYGASIEAKTVKF